MVGASTDENPPSGDQGVPTTLDVAHHFRELRKVVLPALLVGLLCAGVVFGVRSFAPSRWDATVTARADVATVTQTSTADAASVALLTAPYVALGVDTRVLHDIVEAARVPWTDSDAASRITVSDSQTPGLVTVAVSGNSAEQASVVAKQAVITLDSAARTRAREAAVAAAAQMQDDASALNDQVQSLAVLDPKRAALQAQYQSALDQISQVRGAGLSRLAALADPVTSAGPVSPKPARDAALALLVGLIVAAEIMVGVRGRWGNKVSVSWARRVARRCGAVFVDDTKVEVVPDVAHLESVVLSHLRSGSDVALMNAAAADSRVRTLAEAVHETVGEGHPSGSFIDLSGDEQWWRHPVLKRAALAIVVAHRGAVERATVARQLTVLAEGGLSSVLMLREPPPAGAEAAAQEVETEARPADDDAVGETEDGPADPQPTEVEDEKFSQAARPGWQIVP